MSKPAIYLCGPITGLSYNDAFDGWRGVFQRTLDPARLDHAIDIYNPMRHQGAMAEVGCIEATNEAYEHNPLMTERAVVAKDKLDVKRSSLIVVCLLGATTITVGSLIELGWADAWDIPILLIMEKSGNPHEHLFVRTIASFRTDNIEEAASMAYMLLLP